MALSTGNGKYNYDSDKCIKVSYDKLVNVEKYIKLSADYQKIKIKCKAEILFEKIDDDWYEEYGLVATKITSKTKND